MHTDTDVLIIGTGFSGLGMAIRLKRAGLDNFTVLEQANGVGGTWRDNDYPGVACDVPSHLYSFSFEPNPNWSRMFAPQSEILAYLNHCADKYGVRPHIQFGSEVVKAEFDDKRGQWLVTTKSGKRYRARALVCGGGGLSKPVFPNIPGLARFQGKKFHSARWDHDYPLEGQRVAVIGTGASAIQIVPSVVDKVGQLKLFQRTAPWILPKPDLRFGGKAQERFADHPWLQTLLRRGLYWLLESSAIGFTGLVPGFQQRTQTRASAFLQAEVKDPVLRAKLTPDYRIGCKRILLSNNYYAALQRPNAAVVTDGIAEIREHSIVTRDGQEHAVDAIIFATGFQAAEAMAPFDVVGRNGTELIDAWREVPEAYLGSAVSGFPNMFMIVGPNTGLGHNSMVFMIESQIQYVFDALRTLRERSLAWVDVKPSVQKSFNDKLMERMTRTVWSTGGCVSWYQNKAGRNTTLWPGFTFEFRYRTRQFDVENYESRALSDLQREPLARGESVLQGHPAE
jgi:cation diffusion facilitator CzcD-associated flavoprotein CzcO